MAQCPASALTRLSSLTTKQDTPSCLTSLFCMQNCLVCTIYDDHVVLLGAELRAERAALLAGRTTMQGPGKVCKDRVHMATRLCIWPPLGQSSGSWPFAAITLVSWPEGIDPGDQRLVVPKRGNAAPSKKKAHSLCAPNYCWVQGFRIKSAGTKAASGINRDAPRSGCGTGALTHPPGPSASRPAGIVRTRPARGAASGQFVRFAVMLPNMPTS